MNRTRKTIIIINTALLYEQYSVNYILKNIISSFENRVDPDQLTSSEAS